MKPNVQAVLDMCIENGVKRGMNRAYKHIDTPTQEQIINSIQICVWEEIYEWFQFDDKVDIL